MGDGLVMLWVMGWVGLLAVPVAASFTAKAGAEGGARDGGGTEQVTRNKEAATKMRAERGSVCYEVNE